MSYKLKKYIEDSIKEIEEDDRYQEGLKSPAKVDINAPLALMQMGMESKMIVLKKCNELIKEK